MSTTRGIPEPPKRMGWKVEEETSPVGPVSTPTARATLATWLVIVSSAIALGVGSIVVVRDGLSTPKPVLTGAYQSYESLESLFTGADVVAVVTVGHSVGYEVDGDEESSDTGVPMVFLEVSVDHYYKVPESLALNRKFTVGLIDQSVVQVPELTEFAYGSKLLVFGEYLPADDSPGIVSIGDFVVPLSADNGVFDVTENRVKARSLLVLAVTDAEVAAARSSSATEPSEVRDQRVGSFLLSSVQSLVDSAGSER